MSETRHDRGAACSRLELELQSYMEGEDRPFVLAHTRECAFCRVVVEDLEGLRAAARALPLQEPSPVVWSNIRARLAAEGAFTEKASLWNWFNGLDFLRRPIPVAAFISMVILGCLVSAPRKYPEQDLNSALAAPAVRTAVQSMGFTADGEALERAVRELEEAFRAREGSLAPDVKATYEKSLLSLDASIRECSDSLQHEPGNSMAHDYLFAAYSQKAEVLSSALDLDEGR